MGVRGGGLIGRGGENGGGKLIVIDAWGRNPFLSPLSGRPSPLRLTQG